MFFAFLIMIMVDEQQRFWISFGFWGATSGVLGRLRDLFAASWGVLGASWGVLETSWERLGTSWGLLGGVLERFGYVFIEKIMQNQ